MKVFCQTLFNNAMPAAVKSIIAKELLGTYGFTQEQIAERLGITQAAVSQYSNGVRGKKVNSILSNEKLSAWVKKLASEIASGNFKLGEADCDLCAETRKELKDKDLGSFVCLMEMYEMKHVK